MTVLKYKVPSGHFGTMEYITQSWNYEIKTLKNNITHIRNNTSALKVALLVKCRYTIQQNFSSHRYFCMKVYRFFFYSSP